MANKSYLKDHLGFDPDEWLSEVDEIIKGERTDQCNASSPSNRTSYKYQFTRNVSSSSSTGSPVVTNSFKISGANYENALSSVKGKNWEIKSCIEITCK